MTAPPSPPSSFSQIKIQTISAGTKLQRIHTKLFNGNDFNPCKGRPSRFAPIEDSHRQCISSLYGASTLECAVFETVFHDVPYHAKTKTVPIDEVMDRAHSELVVIRDISLIALHESDLKAWGTTRRLLIDTLACHYQDTARWAEALHRAEPHADGLVWTSRQYDPDQAMLLYGDRVAPSDLTVTYRRDAISDRQLVREIREIGRRANITIVS